MVCVWVCVWGGVGGWVRGSSWRSEYDGLNWCCTDEHTMDFGPDSDDLFPDPPSSQLTRWKPLSLSEVQVGRSP